MTEPSETFRSKARKVARGLAPAVTCVADTPYRWLWSKMTSSRSVLFMAGLPSHFALLEPIYKALAGDPRLMLGVTAPGVPDDDDDAANRCLSIEGRAPEIFPWRQVAWRRWDVCIEPDYFEIPPRRPTKRVQIFHGTADKVTPGGDNFTLAHALRNYERIFCLSPDHLATLQQHNLERRKGAAVCIGYPKLDCMVTGALDRDAILRDYGAGPARRSVLYAPSWNPELSAHTIGEQLTDLLSGRDFTLLVKLHPISYRDKPPSPGSPRWGLGHNWSARLDDLHRKGRIIHVRDQDSCRFMTAADVLITDFGSTLFEYMVRDLPILYYDTPEASAVTSAPEVLQAVRAAAHCFGSPEEALSLLEQGPRDRDGMSEARRELVRQRFYDVGGATGRATRAIYDLLSIPPFEGGQ